MFVSHPPELPRPQEDKEQSTGLSGRRAGVETSGKQTPMLFRTQTTVNGTKRHHGVRKRRPRLVCSPRRGGLGGGGRNYTVALQSLPA